MKGHSLILTVFMAFFAAIGFAQSNPMPGIDVLRNAKNLMRENSYDHALSVIEDGLAQENAVSDSARAELYYCKFLAQYHQSKNSSSRTVRDKESLLKAIASFETLETKDKQRMGHFYREYLRTLYPDTRSETEWNDYKTFTIKLFKGGFYASDFEKLKDIYAGECYFADPSIRNHKIDSLTAELRKDINPRFLSTYVKYIKANFSSHTYTLPGICYFNGNNELRKSWTLYADCLAEYESLRERCGDKTQGIDRLMAECLNDMTGICEQLNAFDVASIYQREYLGLIGKWWKFWDVRSPWHAHKNYANHNLYSYEKYMEYLEKSNQYDVGISYSHDVMRRLGEYDMMESKEYVESYIEWFEDLRNGVYQKESFDSGMRNNRLASLYNSDNYAKTVQVADSIITHGLKWYNEEIKGGNYIAAYFGDPCIKSSHEQDLLFAKREGWWFANGDTEYWEALVYKALVAANEGRNAEAIRLQEEVVDIVKADYEFDPCLRDRMIASQSYVSLQYLSTEIYQLMNLAWYYFEGGRGRDASDCIGTILMSVRGLMEGTIHGTDIAKYDLWNDTFQTLREILHLVMANRETYPAVDDHIVEIFSLMKSVRQTEKISTLLAIRNFGGSQEEQIALQNDFNAKLNLDRLIDQTYYTEQKEQREQLMKERFIHQTQIDRLIEGDKILSYTHIDTDFLRKHLKRGDIYVDFLTFSTRTDTTEYFFADSLRRDMYTYKSTPRLTFFAVTFKPEWDHARLLQLCDNVTEIGEGIGALTEYTGTNSSKTYDFYTSPTATEFVWGQLLKETGAEEGSRIFFIPMGDLAEIAIEQMKTAGGLRICDLYECYRMTSAWEIGRHSQPLKPYDSAALFHDMDYAWVNSSRMLPGLRANLSNPRSEGIAAAMQDIFHTNLLHYAGRRCSEQDIAAMSGRSPACIHLTTHGFSRFYGDLSEEEEKYLVGNRPEYMTDIEKSMFRTGLYMSASDWSGNNFSNDGLLTSHEISLLDLSNTRLCVLSACSTAGGHKSTEGVFGLQKAFKLAGVKSLLVTLWDVDNGANDLLMEKFYGYIAASCTPIEALRKAQLDVKNHVNEEDYMRGLDNVHKYENPYYWAGFILLDAN